jgi:hypothetical protein
MSVGRGSSEAWLRAHLVCRKWKWKPERVRRVVSRPRQRAHHIFAFLSGTRRSSRVCIHICQSTSECWCTDAEKKLDTMGWQGRKYGRGTWGLRNEAHFTKWAGRSANTGTLGFGLECGLYTSVPRPFALTHTIEIDLQNRDDF